MQIIRQSEFRSTPWKNGGGITREAIRVRGGGVALKFSSGEERLLRKVGDVAEFDGALATQCELPGGPCVDLNLMVAKSLPGVRAQVQRLHQPLELPAAPGRATLVFPIDTALEVRAGGAAAALEPWDLAVISHATGQTGTLVPRDDSTGALVFLATLPDI
jgi:environmental stress-induced protein Ves